MLHLLRNRRAQNTMEYAILIALVIGVFSAMQIYLRRGMQARIKAGTDNIPGEVLTQAGSNANLFGTATQYEPYYIREGTYSMTTTSGEGTERGAVSESGGVRDLSGATTQRTGEQQITGPREDTLTSTPQD